MAARLDAADVGVVRARDGEADARYAGDERDVGQVRAAGVGVVERRRRRRAPGRGRMTAATASGMAPRWTGMCSACAIMRPRCVEERGRAVAALLDVRREGRADEHGAHLLGDRAQGAADEPGARLFTVCVQLAAVLRPIPNPHPPGGIQQVAPSSSSTAGPVTSNRRPAGSSIGRGPGRTLRGPNRDELDLAGPGRRSRSAPRARGGTRSARSGPSGNRQLERLPCGSGGRPRPPPAARPPPRAGTTYERTRVAPLVARHESERRQHAGCRRDEHCRDPELLRRAAHACSGPAPPKATSAKSARVVPALDRDDAQRAQHLGVRRHATTAAGSISAERALGRRAVELDAAREAARAAGPSRRFASVTVGCVPPRP